MCLLVHCHEKEFSLVQERYRDHHCEFFKAADTERKLRRIEAYGVLIQAKAIDAEGLFGLKALTRFRTTPVVLLGD